MTDQGGDWLYKFLDTFQRDHREVFTELRLEMSKDTDEIKALIREQNGRIGRSETRLTVIETERASEERQAIKRGATTSLLVSSAVMVAMELIKSWKSWMGGN
jgi:hypothetical protein